jgi:hypothetical protein
MVYFDWKIFVVKTEKNLKKLKDKGFTQIETKTDCCDWYIAPDDYAEDWEGTEEELEDLIDQKIDERLMFQRLIENTFPNGYLMIWGNKKDPSDNLWTIFQGESYWEKYEELKKWIRRNFKIYLIFENDDLNGWYLAEWRIPSKLKDLAEKVKDIVS